MTDHKVCDLNSKTYLAVFSLEIVIGVRRAISPTNNAVWHVAKMAASRILPCHPVTFSYCRPSAVTVSHK